MLYRGENMKIWMIFTALSCCSFVLGKTVPKTSQTVQQQQPQTFRNQGGVTIEETEIEELEKFEGMVGKGAELFQEGAQILDQKREGLDRFGKDLGRALGGLKELFNF